MIWKIWKLSIKSVWNNKLRSFLTMLGIIIGVMAVVILVSVTEGAANGITDSISSMGSDLVMASITDDSVSITEDNLDSLANGRNISAVAPVISTSETVKKGTESGSYTLNGVTEEYFDITGATIQRGRSLVESDDTYETKVCVIGTDVAEDLFDTWDAVNGTIIIGNDKYTVVGVLEEQGSSMSGSGDSSILIPFSTAEKLTGTKNINTFYAKAKSAEVCDMAKNYVESYLLRITQDEDAYSVSNASDVIDTMEDVDSTMSLLIAGIAAISLLVGGIGIMNIMLVSVTERTKEIGIRKAVGAKRKHILFQFLCEALVLSVIGGLIGLLLSEIGLQAYNIIGSTDIAMNRTVAFSVLGFCILIGIIFGLYPANKASKLLPIDALHT